MADQKKNLKGNKKPTITEPENTTTYQKPQRDSISRRALKSPKNLIKTF